MIDQPEYTPAPTTEIPGPDLFMIVLKVADWPGMVNWYVERLGLLEILVDEQHRFALLAAGGGRLALQGDQGGGSTRRDDGVRLVFLVPDVDHERTRLLDKGIEVGAPIDNLLEGYREIRFRDPEGTSLSFFAWTDSTQFSRFRQPPG